MQPLYLISCLDKCNIFLFIFMVREIRRFKFFIVSHKKWLIYLYPTTQQLNENQKLFKLFLSVPTFQFYLQHQTEISQFYFMSPAVKHIKSKSRIQHISSCKYIDTHLYLYNLYCKYASLLDVVDSMLFLKGESLMLCNPSDYKHTKYSFSAYISLELQLQ